jgi:cation transport regulator ChaB
MRLRDLLREVRKRLPRSSRQRKQRAIDAINAVYDHADDRRAWRSMENAAHKETFDRLHAMAQAQARCSYCGKPAMEFILTSVCAEHRINEAHAMQNRYQGLTDPYTH